MDDIEKGKYYYFDSDNALLLNEAERSSMILDDLKLRIALTNNKINQKLFQS